MRGWCAGVLSWVSSALEGVGFAHVYPQHWAQLLRDWGEEAGHAESRPSFSASLLQLGGRKSFNQEIFLYWQNCGKFSTLATMISMPRLLGDTRVEFLTSLLWLTKGLFVDENRMCLVIEQRFPRISGPPPKEDPHLLPSLGIVLHRCKPSSIRVDWTEYAHLFPSQSLTIHTDILIVQNGRFSPGKKAGTLSHFHSFELKYR